jgi:predicted permease
MDIGGIWTRFRQATRRLGREWRYSLGVILILGIGIGPAAAMLSVVQKVLLKPLAYEQPGQLGLVRISLGEMNEHPGACLSEITDLRNVQGLFSAVEATSREFEFSLGEDEDMSPVPALRVTPGLFDMLGVSPMLGRHFTEEDTESLVAMISHGLWTSRFGGDPEIIGRTLTLNGFDAPVIGVMPPGFALYLGRGSQLSSHIDVWSPLPIGEHRAFWGFPTIVRLADGVTFEQANAGLQTFTQSLVEQYPEIYANTDARFAVHALLPDLVRQARPAIQAALAGVLLLLVIAIANGTALVLARMKAREVDFAVRTAMGAGRGMLVQEVFIESMLLMGAGIAVGGGIAVTGIVGLQALIPDSVPRASSVALGWDLLVYAALLGFAGLTLAGLFPAWKASRGAPLQLLRGDSGQRGATRATTRYALVGSQIAMTVVLAFGAVQLARSALELADADLRYDPENVLTFRVPVDGRRFESWEERMVFHHELRDRLSELPSVRAVGAISHLPLSGRGPVDAFGPGAVGDTVDWHDPLANYFAVLPGYLESIGVFVSRGRTFTDEDNLEARAVAVIDETLAEMAWPGEDPIGKTMRMGWQIPVSTVIGVIPHPRVLDVSQEVRPQIYVPYGLFRWPPLNYTIRAERDPTGMIGRVREVLGEMQPGRAASGFQLLETNVFAAMSTLKFVTVLVALLAASAVLLSALGLYATVSYVVHQRRRATAIRGAMGATPAQLLRFHLASGGVVLAVAVPIGLMLALTSARFVEALLYGVTAHSVVSLSVAALLATMTGVIGTYIPARSAAAADPAQALRVE